MKVFIHVGEIDNYGEAITAFVAANSKEEAREVICDQYGYDFMWDIDNIFEITKCVADVDKPQILWI